MSMDSGLRVRKDLAGEHQDEEDVYLLSSAVEHDGRCSKNKKSRAKACAPAFCFRLVLIMLFLSCFVLISAYSIHP